MSTTSHHVKVEGADHDEYVVSCLIPGLVFRVADKKGDLVRYTRAHAEQVAMLHTRLFKYRAVAEKHRPNMPRYETYTRGL